MFIELNVRFNVRFTQTDYFINMVSVMSVLGNHITQNGLVAMFLLSADVNIISVCCLYIRIKMLFNQFRKITV